MDLYKPPLLEKSRKDSNTTSAIKEALKGIKVEVHFTGNRMGKDLISLMVCSLIEDNSENLFLRLCTYSGLKEKWKDVIINQVKLQLQDLNVEKGFVRSETRYLEVNSEQFLSKGNFQKLYSNLKAKVIKKKDENNPI